MKIFLQHLDYGRKKKVRIRNEILKDASNLCMTKTHVISVGKSHFIKLSHKKS